MLRFYEIEPSLENYWRAIILFGRNTASYKFALAQSLIGFLQKNKTDIKLEELAVPYSKHICKHLKQYPKQSTNKASTFLKKLQEYNIHKLSHDKVIEETVRHGFRHVLDAFHNVHNSQLNTLFFINESKTSGRIQLTDNLFKLSETSQFNNFDKEVESRWNLVESAWENNLSKNLMLVTYNNETQKLIGITKIRRINVTSARPALNGYQKGRCFYCYREISISGTSDDLGDVDHFFPHKLKICDSNKPIDSVANLVLACKECNRGSGGKFDQLPSVKLLQRLYSRNEYLISSHHPLRGTLINQTGNTAVKRQEFMQTAYNCASVFLGSHKKWQPSAQGKIIF